MGVKFTNNAYTTLASTISASATSFDIASAATFPTLAAGDWTYVSLTNEVVKVTAISGVTCTCVAVSGGHSSGIPVELRMTAELLNDFAEDLQAGYKGGDIASASPTVIGTDGDYFDVTGTTGFSAFTVAANRLFVLQFDGALIMTHHATNLDLPGEANITTAAGDVAKFFSTGANTVQCINYTKANGGAVKIVDESIDSDAYVDLSIDTAHIADDQVTYAKIQNVSATNKILGRDSASAGVIEEISPANLLTMLGVETGATADQSASEIKTLLEDGIDSVHYVDGSIDNEHIADDAIDSEHYVDGSIDNAHIADDAIDSEHYAAASIDAEHLSVGLGGALSLDASPDTDHTANGPQTNTLASGYSSTIMDLVYLGSGSKWLEADSDATGTSINLLGIALEAKTDTQAMNVALPGSFVRDDSWSWTPGVPLYISGTLGAITATKPTGSGDVVRTVGYAVHADYIFFAPSSDYVTLV